MGTEARRLPPLSTIRGAATLLGAQLLVLGGGFAANIVISRSLGPAGRGEVAFVLQAAYLVTVVGVLGRDKAYPALGEVGTLRTALRDQLSLIRAPIAAMLFLSGCVYVLTKLSAPIGWHQAGLLFLICAGTAMSRLSRASAIASGVAGPHMYSTIASQCLLLAGLATVWSLGSTSSVPWLAIYAVSGILPFLALGYWAHRADPSNDRRRWRVRKFGLTLLAPAVSEIAVMRMDRLLLPSLAGYGALGLYATVATLAELGTWPAQQYADSRVPAWSRSDRSRRSLALELGSSLGISCVCSVVTAAGTYLLLVPVFGEGFSGGLRLVMPLTVAAVLVSLYRMMFAMTIATNIRIARSVQTWCSVVLVAGLYPWWIWEHGALGAAWASSVALGFSAVAGGVVWFRCYARR